MIEVTVVGGRARNEAGSAVGRFTPGPAVVAGVLGVAMILSITGLWWLLSLDTHEERCAVLQIHVELMQIQAEDAADQTAVRTVAARVAELCG